MLQLDFLNLAADIKNWGKEIGFQQIGITDIDLTSYRPHLEEWLQRNFHGEMEYMSRHAELRCHPELLVPGTLRVVCARMDYARTAENAFTDLNSDG
ncbi:MAG: hypothetical protein WD772_02450, partial [Pseudohongiellaceae bacterium]